MKLLTQSEIEAQLKDVEENLILPRTCGIKEMRKLQLERFNLRARLRREVNNRQVSLFIFATEQSDG